MKRRLFLLISIISCFLFCGVSFAGDDIILDGKTVETLHIVEDTYVSKKLSVPSDGELFFKIKTTVRNCKVYIRSVDDGNDLEEFEVKGSNEYTTIKINASKGDYNVNFRSNCYDKISEGTVTFSCSFKKADITIQEKHNSFKTAANIKLNTEIKDFFGDIRRGNDVKYYKVDLKNDGLLKVNFNTAISRISIVIIDEFGNSVCGNTYYASICDPIFNYYLDRGKYIIKLSNVGYQRDDYGRISFSANLKKSEVTKYTNNHALSDAYYLKDTNCFKGVMTENYEEEYYKFDVKEKKKTTILLDTDSKYAYVGLLNSYGETLEGISKGRHTDCIINFTVNPGTYYIKISDIRIGFYHDEFRGNFTLSVGYNIGEFTAKCSKTDFLYNGKKQVVSPVIKKNGVTLKKNVDYTLNFSNNIYPGKATVVVKGKGKYIGSISMSYMIYLPNISNAKIKSKTSSSVKLQWKKNSLVNGYVIDKYDFTKNKYVPYKFVSKNVSTYTIKGLKKNADYCFRIRGYVTVNKSKRYSPGGTDLYVKF